MDLRYTIYERPKIEGITSDLGKYFCSSSHAPENSAVIRNFDIGSFIGIVIAPSRSAGGLFLIQHMISTESTYREKLETDARARIFWGDAQADVVKYMVENGTDQREANEMVEAFVHERADTIRKMGFKKILIGIACLAAPLIPWIILSAMLHRFFMPPVMFACVPGSIAVYGLYSLFKGTMMYLMPDSETGDVAEAD